LATFTLHHPVQDACSGSASIIASGTRQSASASGAPTAFVLENRVNDALEVSRALGDHSSKSLDFYTSGVGGDFGAAGNYQN
jgi:Protein phosphatase 2C